MEESRSPAAGSPAQHLFLVLQADPAQWAPAASDFQRFFDEVLLYLHAFLILNRNNLVTVFLFRAGAFRRAFPGAGVLRPYSFILDSHKVRALDATLLAALRRFAATEGVGDGEAASNALAACIARSACHIRRSPFTPPPSLRSALTAALANRWKQYQYQQWMHILPHSDVGCDYSEVLNAAQAFGEIGVIHVSPLHRPVSSLYFQIASLARGNYAPLPVFPILPALMSFLASADTPLTRPSQRMSTTLPCVCHQREITNGIAYACSLCLSIYCRRVDHCDVCHARLT